MQGVLRVFGVSSGVSLGVKMWFKQINAIFNDKSFITVMFVISVIFAVSVILIIIIVLFNSSFLNHWGAFTLQ